MLTGGTATLMLIYFLATSSSMATEIHPCEIASSRIVSSLSNSSCEQPNDRGKEISDFSPLFQVGMSSN